MSIDRNTPYRDVGPVPYSYWRSRIIGSGGRAELASEAAWEAAGSLSAVLLRILNQESSYDSNYNKNSRANNNPYNIRVLDRSNEDNPRGYVAYPDLVTATAAARDRLLGAPGYFTGANPYANAVTIEDLLYTYAPPPWNDTETLIERMEIDLNAWLPRWSPPVNVPSTGEEPVEQEKPMARVYGKVPKPKFVWAPVYKRAGAGYNQLSAVRKLVGVAFHEWMGVSSLTFHKQFFACSSPGVCPSGYTCYPGERCADALVDGFVMKDGTMVLINDPWGTRAPWASGGSGPYEGDGAAFASVFGSAGFNSRLFSVEVVKLTNENYTAAQIQTLGEWSAYIHDQDGQAWDEHPYTSKYKCVTDILHYEASAGTSCGRNELDDVTKVQAVAKQIMRSYQEQITVPGPIQPEVPVQPDPPLPGNADANKAAAAFGSLRRVNTINDSVSSGHTYDPKGPISLEYTRQCVAAYGLDYSKWPAGEDWVVMNDSGKTLQIITFSNDWRLVSAAERAGWALMDFKEIDGAAA